MRHTVDANCDEAGKFRGKSNVLDGLSIGDAADVDGAHGWARFSGKSVFNEPGLEGEGNHPFLVYFEDHSNGMGNQDPADDFWIQVKDKDGVVLFETGGAVPVQENGDDGDDVSIENGNITVPSSTKGGKGPRPARNPAPNFWLRFRAVTAQRRKRKESCPWKGGHLRRDRRSGRFRRATCSPCRTGSARSR
jgi:hypothetical protein